MLQPPLLLLLPLLEHGPTRSKSLLPPVLAALILPLSLKSCFTSSGSVALFIESAGKEEEEEEEEEEEDVEESSRTSLVAFFPSDMGDSEPLAEQDADEISRVRRALIPIRPRPMTFT